MKRFIVALLALTIGGFGGDVWAGPTGGSCPRRSPRLGCRPSKTETLTRLWQHSLITPCSSQRCHRFGSRARKQYEDITRNCSEIYPRRRVLPRQSTARVYNDDLVITNSYSVLHLTNQQGEVMSYPVRSSLVWAKIGGRWQIVDQHGSRLPVAP